MAEAIRVLYVDDESALLDLCKIYLERSGDFTVTTATSAPEAIRILELNRFDAIVSDYQMPEMDGIEFLKVVRARRDKTPFIVFTGKGREEVVIEAMNSGADFYLQKGGEAKAQFAELAHKIRHAVSHRQADKALIASEARYRTVFENTGSATVIVEENNIISLANTRFELLSGFAKEELEGKKTWTEFVVKEDLAQMLIQHKLRRADRDKALKQYEFRFITRSGEIRDILLNIDVIPRTKKSVASLIDITERKASEQVLKKGQIQLAETMDLAHMANWEFDVASGNFTFNDRFYALYGTTAEREGGYQMPAEVYAREFVHPDEVSLVASEVQNAINATDPDYTRTIEHRIIRRDGEIRQIIVRFGITKDADGKTVKTYGANQDITERKKAVDELRETNEYLHKLIDFANAPIIVWDPDFRITRFNHASEHLTGRVEQEVIGQPLDILFPEETRDASLALIKKTLAGERWETVEIPILASDGIIHTVLWNTANILTAEADLISTIAQGVDITERMQSEKTLTESEQKFRALVEHALDGILITDFQGKVLFANNAVARMVEADGCAALIGRNVMEFIAPESREDVVRDFSEVASGHDAYLAHYFVISAKGKKIRVESMGKVICYEGKPADFISIRDITESEQAVAALRESEEKYRDIYEHSVAGLFKIAPDGRLIDANDALACMFGYSGTAEIIARGLDAGTQLYADPEDRKNMLHILDGGGIVENYETKTLKRDGSLFWISITARTIRNADGTALFYEGSVIDITKDKRVEEELQAKERQLSLIYRNVSEVLFFLSVEQNNRYRFLSVNQSFLDVTGLTQEQVVGKYVHEVIPEPSLTLVLEKYKQAIQDNITVTWEELTEYPAGKKYGEVSVTPLIDATGRCTNLIGSVHDITDRKRSELALHESEERFRYISELIPDFAYSCRKTPGGEFAIDWITGEPEQITGYTADEIKNMTCWKFLVVDEDIPVFEKNVTGLSPGESVRCELRIRRKDGGIKWLSCYAKCVTNLMEPGYLYLYGGCRDITDRKRSEEVLKKSEEKSRSLLENVPELILVHRNGIILYTNPAAVKSLGYQPHEVISRRVTEFIAPEFHERVATAVLQRMNGKPVEPYEIDVIGKDGSRRNMIVNGSMIEFDGAPASLIILTDITERKRVEEELKRSESRLRAVVEDQTEFICRFTLGGRLTFVNEAYCRYFGLDRPQCLTQSHHVVLPPEDALLMKKHLASLTRENPVAAIDHRIIMPSGEVRWQRWNDRAIFGENGRVTEYQSVGRDITENKTVEIALHESEERFEQIAESAGEWIWEVDTDGVYTYSNAMVYEILGYTPEEIIKRKHFYDLFVPEDQDQLKESAFRAFANHEPFKGFVNANLHKNGDRVILETSGFPILDTNGNLTGYRGTDINITARITAEEALRERERELADIISFLPDATLVIDKIGTVLAWNRAMEEMTGVPAEQMIGKTDYEYALPFYNERRPITADLVLHDDPAVAAKYPFMKKEGNSLLAEIYIPHLNKGSGAYLWFKASPLYDAAGNISGAIESIRDITDKKRAEEELRDAHEKYTKAFLSAPDAIAISELDTGRFIEVNDAATRIFGYSRDELIGKSALELGILLKKEDRELLIDQVREQGRVSQFELSERRKSGELYNALINADTISIGNVPYLLTLVQDITDRKRAEQSAKENLVLYQTLSES
ncbi:MAG: PAS domain S-box protein, partial [Methanoregula sp.]